MEREEFIQAIGKAVQKIAPKYGIYVCSPIIAQACLESAYGTAIKRSITTSLDLNTDLIELLVTVDIFQMKVKSRMTMVRMRLLKQTGIYLILLKPALKDIFSL